MSSSSSGCVQGGALLIIRVVHPVFFDPVTLCVVVHKKKLSTNCSSWDGIVVVQKSCRFTTIEIHRTVFAVMVLNISL